MTIDDIEYSKDGKLVWSRTKGRSIQGNEIGWVSKHGYREMQLDNQRKKVHHVVWFLHTGQWPTMLDHINGNRLDNRIENLRTCSSQENARNTAGWKNRELPRNVYSTQYGKYRAALCIGGKFKQIGTFDTIDEADKAATTAREVNYGAFSGYR